MNIIKVESRLNGESSKIDGVIGLTVTCDLIGIEFGNIDALINAIMKFSTFGKLKIEVITGDTYFIEASTSVINVGMMTLTDKMSAFRTTGRTPQDFRSEVFEPRIKVPEDISGDIAHAVMFNIGKTKDGKTSSSSTDSDIGKSVHEVADEYANTIFNTVVQPGLVGLFDHIIVSERNTKDLIKRFYTTVGNLSFGAIGDALKGTKEEI